MRFCSFCFLEWDADTDLNSTRDEQRGVTNLFNKLMSKPPRLISDFYKFRFMDILDIENILRTMTYFFGCLI